MAAKKNPTNRVYVAFWTASVDGERRAQADDPAIRGATLLMRRRADPGDLHTVGVELSFDQHSEPRARTARIGASPSLAHVLPTLTERSELVILGHADYQTLAGLDAAGLLGTLRQLGFAASFAGNIEVVLCNPPGGKNSLSHMRHPDGSLWSRAFQAAMLAEGQHATVTVRDTPIGLFAPADLMGHRFGAQPSAARPHPENTAVVFEHPVDLGTVTARHRHHERQAFGTPGPNGPKFA